MDRITKLLIVLSIIIAILVFLGIGYLVIDSDKQNTDVNNEVTYEDEDLDEEGIEEVKEEEKEEEPKTEENVLPKEVSEDPEANTKGSQVQAAGREEQQTGVQSNQKTDEQKVVELAKKKWGENDNSVSFNIVNREGHIFKVSVNNKATTAVLAWYTVNLATGEVTQ